jgi:hypothetical protein
VGSESEIHPDREDFALWNTYVHQAWIAARDLGQPVDGPAFIPECTGRKLKGLDEQRPLAILWAAFCLEYRLRSILVLKEKDKDKGYDYVGLGKLLNDVKDPSSNEWEFWRKLGRTPPREWAGLKDTLIRLKNVRDALAHGNGMTAKAQLAEVGEEDVKRMFNAVMKAIRVISQEASDLKLDYSDVDRMQLK